MRLRSPLIDEEITGASGILLSIAGGDDMTLIEVNEAAEAIRAAATEDTNIIFGATVDDRLTGQVWVTVVATGIGRGARVRRPPFEAPVPARRSSERRRRGRSELPALGSRFATSVLQQPLQLLRNLVAAFRHSHRPRATSSQPGRNRGLVSTGPQS